MDVKAEAARAAVDVAEADARSARAAWARAWSVAAEENVRAAEGAVREAEVLTGWAHDEWDD